MAMKIEHTNKTIYINQNIKEANNNNSQSTAKKSFYAGNLMNHNSLHSRIEEKKEQAKKQAMKIVGDAFTADKAIDDDLENRRNHVMELQEEKAGLTEEFNGITERRNTIQKAYENGELSEADYAKETDALNEYRKELQKQIGENYNDIIHENAVIKGTKLELLKQHTMVDAQKQADTIMDSASNEIIAITVQDAKDQIDDKTEESKEKAEKLKEEREEFEERIEKQRDNNLDHDSLDQDLITDEILSLDKLKNDTKQEVQEMIDKMKLLAEDIKGAAVDEVL